MSDERAPSLLRIDHVQLAIPRDTEETCRAFYCGVLGLSEMPKPPTLAARGGLWLTGGPVQIHLGVEDEFRPARKAHPAFVVSDLDGLGHRLTAAGCAPVWDDKIPQVRRFFASDPFGNRLEFMESSKDD
jgi:catechol 2,3-dioxygenase-like lactoylglutathione lyase family enzyme